MQARKGAPMHDLRFMPEVGIARPVVDGAVEVPQEAFLAVLALGGGGRR